MLIVILVSQDGDVAPVGNTSFQPLTQNECNRDQNLDTSSHRDKPHVKHAI